MASTDRTDTAAQRTANSMRRLLEALGIQRRPRDVTPTLDQYLDGKYATHTDNH
jgi:hypothetical protein